MNTDLQTAIEMIRLGDTPSAYKLVANHVRKYPKDSHAWYLLSFTVDKKEQKIDCLERALKLSPDYFQAKKRLLQLTQTNTYDKNTPTKISVDEETTSTENHTIEITTQGHKLVSEIPSVTLLDPVIENWCSNLSYREQKVIEYLYLSANYFSVGAVGRIISESPAKVLDIRKRAFDKLHQNYINLSIDPLMSSVITAIKNNGDLNESDLVAVLQDTWSAKMHNLIGLVRLIRSIEDTYNEFSKNKINEPQSNNNLGQGKSIPKNRLKKPIDKEQSPPPTKGPVPDVSDPKNSSDNNAPKPSQKTSSFADEKMVEETMPIGVPKEENTLTHSGSISSNPQKNEPDIESVTGLVLDKEKGKTPSSGKKQTPPFKYEHRLWQMSGGNERRKKRPDVFQFLVEDITRLPIITNPHQELWLGIQLQSVNRLDKILTSKKTSADYVSIPHVICQTLLTAWKSLDQDYTKLELQPPRLEIWVSELLSARRNIYELHRSRLHRFLRNVQKLENVEETKRILDLVYQVVETLAVFPSSPLNQLVIFINNHNCLPVVNEMETWLPHDEDTLKQQNELQRNQAQNILTTGYLRYAIRVAQGYVDRGIPFADLVQVGFWGLLKAAKKFDYRVQVRFGAYATNWIWQAIGREVADHGKMIRLPVHIQETLRKLESACEQFDDGHHDPIRNHEVLFNVGLLEQSDYEILREAGPNISNLAANVLDNYENAAAKARKIYNISLQIFPWSEIQVINHPDERFDRIESIEELLPDNHPYLDYIVDIPFLRQIIEEQVFSFLTEKEREVLTLRYGLADGEERTLEEVGKVFGVTRERIRQIEAKALRTLENRVTLGLLPDLHDLLSESEFLPFQNLDEKIDLTAQEIFDDSDVSNWSRLTDLLAQLPRSDWIKGRAVTHGVQRQEQLLSALEQLSMPAHVSDIAEQVNSAIEGKDLDDNHVYTLMFRDEETFILLGQGIFSLVAWERARASESQPILACCPMPLPDPPDYEDAFFESVLVGQQALSKGLTAVQFTNHMLQWAKVEDTPQKWFVQTILSAYYLVDLIPYVFTFSGENPVLQCTLPTISIQELRFHCLGALTERLVAMPEFWWLLQQHQPARPTDLGEMFADIHPNGLDDTFQRLRLLASLGATQKLKYGEYKLTPLGEECANRWRREVVIEMAIDNESNKSDLENSFSNFIAW